MKKLVFALALSLFSAPIFAQMGPCDRSDRADRSPEKRVELRLRKMAEDLNLTDEQIEAVKPILLDFHQAEAKACEERFTRREEVKEKLSEVLSEEQMSQLEKMRQDRREKGRGMHKQQRGG
tara:strand:+ start:5773 stop:6138 length:366 start_codon:yes stop_codon:yes gene_type:complete